MSSPRFPSRPGPRAPAQHNEKTAFKTALVRGHRKIIHDLVSERWELYDLASDPGETVDLAGQGEADEQELREALSAWEESRSALAANAEDSSPSVRPSAAEIDRLRSLGYIDG